MQVYPVLDLYRGVVVQAIAGKRDDYRRIRSPLVASAAPLDVARAIRATFGLSEFYVADLDAILQGHLNLAHYRELAADGFRLLIDSGLHDIAQGEQVLAAGGTALIAGLESIPGPAFVGELCARFGAEQVLFSLDLKAGKPLGPLGVLPPANEWGTTDPLELAESAIAQGIQKLIVLDLATVGTGTGIPTRELCQRIRERHPALQLLTGGGVRTLDDILPLWHESTDGQLRSVVDGLLIGSALHNGGLSRLDLESLQQRF
jgi:phosphoribosylformimino-5-aminoimidazole carboxamide ribotide isomerase